MTALYAPVLKQMATQWWQDPDYGHGFLVPFFAAFVVWQRKRSWLAVRLQPSNHGLWLMLCAIGLLVVGTLGAELFLGRSSLLLLLMGMLLYLAGWKMLRALAFPLSYYREQ